MQATEMITGVSGAGGRLVEAEEGLVLACQHGVYVREHFVAKLCTVDLGAEPGQLVAAPAPACDERLACHSSTRMVFVNAPPTGLSEPAAPPVILYFAISGGVLRSASLRAKLGEHVLAAVPAFVTPLEETATCCQELGEFSP